MFYGNKILTLGFVGLCTLQIPTIDAMQVSTDYAEHVRQGNTDFKKITNYTRKDVTNLLVEENFAKLQKALRKRFDICQGSADKARVFVEWVRSYNKLSMKVKGKDEKELRYNPLMLYYELDGWQNLAKIQNGLNNNEATRAYIVYIFLTIILYADTCAAKSMGLEDQSIWVFKFLVNKMANIWLRSINNENLNFNFDIDIVKWIKKIIFYKKDFTIKPKFLKRLQSPAWVTCCSLSSWSTIGLYPNTIYFGQPTEAIKELFQKESEKINAARQEAIKKVIKVFLNLNTQTITEKIKESATKLAQL